MHPMSDIVRLVGCYVRDVGESLNIKPQVSYQAMQSAADELDRLHAIVSRLPVTADGVPVVPGMELYGWNDDDKVVYATAAHIAAWADDSEASHWREPWSHFYSTKSKAAESARAAKEADDAIQ